MKKLLFILILSALCIAQLTACSEVDIPMNSVDTDSSNSLTSEESFTNMLPGNSSAADAETQDESDNLSNSGNSVSTEESGSSGTLDDSSTSSQPVKYISTNDYSYKVSLSEAETNCINAGNNGKYLILVNKDNKLPDSYTPDDLTDIRDTRKDRAAEKMVRTAEIALHAFLNEAAENGYDDITITSGYRSIAKQQSLFNMYVNQEMAKGKDRETAIAAASVYSAYPGTSEHHTGLCADMHNLPAASQTFGSTEEAKWLAANAHRFGFILRFPKGKEDITTYMWEPWHFRFVGIHHATQIYESGLCLEEYLAQNDA